MRIRCGPKTRLAFVFPLVLASWTFTQIAQLYAVEQSLCRQHYGLEPDTIIDPPDASSAPAYDCKDPAIQAKTALYNGILQGSVLLPGLIFAGAYNGLARTWGRQAVFSLNAVGITLQVLYRIIICYFDHKFPIEMIFGTGAFVAIGGGDTLQWGLLYAYIFESVSHGNAMFFMCYSSAYLAAGRTFAVMSGGVLLGISIWLLWAAAVVSTVLIAVSAWFLPDPAGPGTSASHSGGGGSGGEYELVDPSTFELDDGDDDDDEERETPYTDHGDTNATATANGTPGYEFPEAPLPALKAPHGMTSTASSSPTNPRGMLSELLESATFAYRALVSKPLQRTIMLVFGFTNIGVGAELVLQQYMSQAYKWPLSFAVKVASLELGAATAVLLTLPHVSGYLQRRRGMSEPRAILAVLNASLLCCTTGAAFMGMGFTWPLFLTALAIYTLGYGGFDAVRAFASTQTHGERATTELTLLITMTEQFTVLIAGPVSNMLFSYTLSVGWLPNGLVFWAEATCSVIAFILTFQLRKAIT